MKRSLIAVVLTLVMLFSFVACNNDKNNNGVNDSADTRGINENIGGYDILDDNGTTDNSGILNNNSTNDMMFGTDMGSR